MLYAIIIIVNKNFIVGKLPEGLISFLFAFLLLILVQEQVSGAVFAYPANIRKKINVHTY